MFTTNPVLLADVKSGNEMSWFKFRDTYRPLIYHCAKEYGVAPADFAEVEQNVLVTFFNAVEKFEYDPKKGKFRTYFGKVIYSCIIKYRREKYGSKENVPVEEAILSGEDDFEKKWEEEYKQHLCFLAMQRAKEELPPEELEVFELFAMQGISPALIAAQKKLSLATVYNYRSRVIAALKRYIRELKMNGDDDYEMF
ncbi:MAG: sigma-70 family RNA polymerase sigma factor [Lentisphaeria bacterium]|nr:sigma-70 family RNA polymerase sigma factor [Lentisphaerota bacterium]MBO5643895.1 sigma-70 family RNA polymerase sigma factor [Lentisphaeria bacterium]MBO5766545.1 sigma-70 family RNA polymerase sigma factor [Lentisphaeria bacterium]MBO5991639.1 sigma-70 family RNA polymerase sigma factor [Lentisphaeria bacterium]MBO7153069.1 sigma-70 family RNA polymerase sigma factor [Lentisphaeria bacterium]